MIYKGSLKSGNLVLIEVEFNSLLLKTLLKSSGTVPVSEKGALWHNVRMGYTPRDLVRSHRDVLKEDPLLFLEALQYHFLLDEHYLLLKAEDKRLRNLEVDAKAKGTSDPR